MVGFDEHPLMHSARRSTPVTLRGNTRWARTWTLTGGPSPGASRVEAGTVRARSTCPSFWLRRCWCPARAGMAADVGDALGQALTAFHRRPASRPHHGGTAQAVCPAGMRLLVVALSRLLVLAQSASSPQKVRKTSINVDHQWKPSDIIRAGQTPYGGQVRRSERGPNRVTPRRSSGSSPAGPHAHHGSSEACSGLPFFGCRVSTAPIGHAALAPGSAERRSE